ncbi:MAG: MotA/TolQ/ExbB proton channel family protein [Gammaproteobacteria bacterium]|nr:MotA/TolQ/ExbB proton channel family protein [Gammaproteobacteria bacterium]
MRRLTDTNLVFRALVILGLIGFGFYLANERGLIRIAFDADRSYISTVILAVYLLASAHWLYLAKALSGERVRLAALEQRVAQGHASAEEAGLVGSFLVNLRARESMDEPAGLVAAFGDALMNRHAFGHFVSDALIKLGLLGTIVGFILMLLPVSEIEAFEPALMQQLLAGMSEGMAVALYTTLAGLVTSTLLKLQYHVLDASAADLATRLGVLADVHAAALRRTDDHDAP